jgi:hypothetical protein
LAAGGPEQIEQEADGRGLARAIQPEEPKNLTPVDVEVEIVQGGPYRLVRPRIEIAGEDVRSALACGFWPDS